MILLNRFLQLLKACSLFINDFLLIAENIMVFLNFISIFLNCGFGLVLIFFIFLLFLLLIKSLIFYFCSLISLLNSFYLFFMNLLLQFLLVAENIIIFFILKELFSWFTFLMVTLIRGLIFILKHLKLIILFMFILKLFFRIFLFGNATWNTIFYCFRLNNFWFFYWFFLIGFYALNRQLLFIIINSKYIRSLIFLLVNVMLILRERIN